MLRYRVQETTYSTGGRIYHVEEKKAWWRWWKPVKKEDGEIAEFTSLHDVEHFLHGLLKAYWNTGMSSDAHNHDIADINGEDEDYFTPLTAFSKILIYVVLPVFCLLASCVVSKLLVFQQMPWWAVVLAPLVLYAIISVITALYIVISLRHLDLDNI